jgi:hypothetical protein
MLKKLFTKTDLKKDIPQNTNEEATSPEATHLATAEPAYFIDKTLAKTIVAVFLLGILITFLISLYRQNLGTVSFGKL